jgi:hypothetical protein
MPELYVPAGASSQFAGNPPTDSVQLRNAHLIIEGSLAAGVFGDVSAVYLKYYPERKALLVAPTDQGWFAKMHTGIQCLLKNKNIRGDKSIALHEILIDFALSDADRPLRYEIQAGGRMLHVHI